MKIWKSIFDWISTWVYGDWVAHRWPRSRSLTQVILVDDRYSGPIQICDEISEGVADDCRARIEINWKFFDFWLQINARFDVRNV